MERFNMHDYALFAEDGSPVLTTDGKPAMLSDLLREAEKYANAQGYELETAVNEHGEDMFRLVKKSA